MIATPMENKGGGVRRNGFLTVFLLSISLCVVQFCGKPAVETEPDSDGINQFLAKTEMILTDKEKKIFKHLPDEVAKREFIDEFWKKRDPGQGMGENEFKAEYERRLEYVENWFSEPMGSPHGWSSDRGKVYLVLGEPDQRNLIQGEIPDRFGLPRIVSKEIWIYNYYRIYLEFIDEFDVGVYRLKYWPVELLSAIQKVRQEAIQNALNTNKFEFKSRVNPGKNEIIISIPARKITFLREDDIMHASFGIIIDVYLNDKKIDRIEFDRDFADSKENTLKIDSIEIHIPYLFNRIVKGKKDEYSFDIIVKDTNSGVGYRELLTFHLK